MHAGDYPQPRPVTMQNGHTPEICNEIFNHGVSTKKSQCVGQEEIGHAWFFIGKHRPIFNSEISDTNKNIILKLKMNQLQHTDWDRCP